VPVPSGVQQHRLAFHIERFEAGGVDHDAVFPWLADDYAGQGCELVQPEIADVRPSSQRWNGASR
jgi:hypothetical protein